MKKKIAITVALCLTICLLFTGCGESITALLSGNNAAIEYKIKDGKATVISVPNKSTITVIDIPDEYDGTPVTEIADYSASNLEYVTEIKIGKNVNKIGSWSMTNNQHLTAFTVDEENESFISVDGVLYTKDMKTVVYCPPAKEGEYKVLDGVESVRSKVFYKCGKLTKVILPESVKAIEEKAFFRCEAMAEINLPDTLETIGLDAFSYCYGLTEITIPKNVNTIGNYAFYNCTNLLKVYVKPNKDSLTAGTKWYPTNNGLEIDGLEIIWK